MTQLRFLPFAALVILSGFLLTACPRPNGYDALRVLPDVEYGQMVGLYPIPGEFPNAVILTKTGEIYRTSLNGDSPASLFLDVSDRLVTDPHTEEGLLGLAFAPDYVTSRRLYIYYTAPGPRRSVVSRFTTTGAVADSASERVILEVPQPFRNHNGGAMAFGPDNLLYIALGDGGSAGDPQGNGQNINTLLGSILRIDVSGDGYTIPPDNPFAAGGGAPEIYAWGFRNPWRIAFDRVTGQLWTADVGQNSYEEVDRVVKGGNYGWNTMEADRCFATNSCDTAGLILPRATYDHQFGCSVTGGYVYRGPSMPELDGWYVYGDYCSGRIWAVDIGSDDGAAIPLADTGLAISSFAQDEAGEIYIVTWNDAIYRLARKPE